MCKLSIYIYSNHVPFDASQKSYGFKSLVKFGTCQKNSKSPFSRDFSKIMPNYHFLLDLFLKIFFASNLL